MGHHVPGATPPASQATQRLLCDREASSRFYDNSLWDKGATNSHHWRPGTPPPQAVRKGAGAGAQQPGAGPHTYRDADLAQDLLGNSLGFFQHLVQRAAVLGVVQERRGQPD